MGRLQLGKVLLLVLFLSGAVLAQRVNDGVRLNGNSIITVSNGTSAAPGLSFAGGNGFDGFYWRTLGHVVFTAQGNPAIDFSSGLLMGASYVLGWNAVNNVATGATPEVGLVREAAGALSINNGGAIGTRINVSGLPSVSACGAGSPAVTAGSTPFSGSVTVGTGAPATCTITFNGTAYATVPHCYGEVETTTAANARATGYSATTTVLTIVPATPWADSSVVNWSCLSPK